MQLYYLNNLISGHRNLLLKRENVTYELVINVWKELECRDGCYYFEKNNAITLSDMSDEDERKWLEKYPPPIQELPIHEHIVKQIIERRDHGLKKYGVGVERTDIDFPGWCQHAIEEAMDFIIYLERAKREYSCPKK